MALHNDFGAWGEKVAEEYMRHKGYSILVRDWKYKHKDLDIVAYEDDTDTLVIVEVKTRHTEEVTTALQSVDKEKEKNLFQATYAFIKEAEHFFPRIRYDIITIIGSEENYTLQHYKNAFRPGYNTGRRLY